MLDGSYNLALVLLSLLIAILSSAAALVLVELSRQNPLRWQQQLGLLAGSIGLGIGIWSMHFIGMLAFRLCTPVDYAANITLLSLLPSVLASWVALNLLRKKQIKALQLISGGVLVGAGIGAMHYSGMAAMQMAVQLRYDPGYFALSIVVAIIMATLALWIRFGVRSWQNRLPSWQLNLLSGIVMGLAISAMHYTGMLAARFVAPVGFTAVTEVANSQQIALIVTSVSVLVTLLVLLLQAVMKFYHAKQSLNRSEQQFRSLIQNIPGAAYRCLPDQHWSMLFISAAVESLCGYPAKDFLLPSPQQD